MAAAVPVIEDDELWWCLEYDEVLRQDRRFELQWRDEVGKMLEDLALRDVPYHLPELVVLEPPPAAGRRSIRRSIKRRRLRGIRPSDDPHALRATKWFRRKPKKHVRRRMLKCTATLPVPTSDGIFVMRTRRRRRAPAPNLRRTTVPPIEARVSDDTPSEEIAAATTEIAEGLDDTDVIVEASTVDKAEVVVVVMPAIAPPVLVFEPDIDVPDPELVALVCGEDDIDQVLELPGGFHVVDGGGRFSRREHLEHLERAATTEPDWGDPEQWDFGRHEPPQLIVRS